MIPSRRALLAAFIVSGSAMPAKAGCFDWLCGRTATPVLPYSVGYAPPTIVTPLGPPVPVGAMGAMGAPFLSTPGGVAPATYAANFGAFNTPSALQMPAYGAIPQPINNPSVLTGLPVNPAAGQAPVSAFRTTINPAFAAPHGSVAAPQMSYNAAAAFQAPAQLSPGVMAQPLYAPAPQTGLGGAFGNNYQTNYNNVPTTVFRPVQQVDPTTGQTVIVQQPCLTTTQQVQRTPYTSLQPAPAAQPYFAEPTCGGEPPRYQSPTQFNATPQYAPQAGMTAPNGYSSSGAAVGSGVSQAGAQDPTYGGAPGNGYNGYVSPIPSTDPAPLQGYPSTPPTLPPVVVPNGSGQPTDRSPVDQPALGSSNWGRSDRAAYDTPRSLPLTTPSTNVSSKYSDLPPIPAADDYRPPAWGDQQNSNAQPYGGESSRPVTPQPTISPPSWNDRTAQRLIEPQGGEQSARYASQTQANHRPTPNPPPAAPIRRNDGGWFPISQ